MQQSWFILIKFAFTNFPYSNIYCFTIQSDCSWFSSTLGLTSIFIFIEMITPAFIEKSHQFIENLRLFIADFVKWAMQIRIFATEISWSEMTYTLCFDLRSTRTRTKNREPLLARKFVCSKNLSFACRSVIDFDIQWTKIKTNGIPWKEAIKVNDDWKWFQINTQVT